MAFPPATTLATVIMATLAAAAARTVPLEPVLIPVLTVDVMVAAQEHL
jgi:hypothetical protein